MAVLSTSYNVESSVKTTLKNTISPTATSGILINYALTITSGVLLLDPGTDREEYISFGGVSVSSGVSTLSDVTRSLSKTANDFSASGTGFQHSGGACIVHLTNYHALYNQKGNLDRANIWLQDQTISGTKKIFLNDSNSWVYDNGTDIMFRSSVQSEVALQTLANLSGVNDKVKISVTDTTTDYLNNKVTAGDGLTKTLVNGGGNETIDFDIDLTDTTIFKDARTGNEARAVVTKASDGLIDSSFLPSAALLPTGMSVAYYGRTAPTGWLLEDGSAVSRTTYAALFAILNPTIGTFTVTIASPGVATLVAHGLATGDSVYLTTTGALPTGLAINTRYWIIKINADTFNLATSLANALAGTAINTSGSQSGTHTLKTTYGVGDGSTTFNVPDSRQRVQVTIDQTSTDFAGMGQTGGVTSVTLTAAQSGVPAHAHPFQWASGSGSGVAGIFTATGSGSTTSNAAGPVAAGTTVTNNTPADAASAHTNLQPYIVANRIIKT